MRFRNSIRLKIAILVFFTTLITILISWSISNHFIEKFYVAHTMNALVKTYRSCNEFFSDEKNIEELENEKIVSLNGYVVNCSDTDNFAQALSNLLENEDKMNSFAITELWCLSLIPGSLPY